MTEPISKIEQIIEKLSTYNTVARVIIMSTKGSAPRKAYSQMFITENQIFQNYMAGNKSTRIIMVSFIRNLISPVDDLISDLEKWESNHPL